MSKRFLVASAVIILLVAGVFFLVSQNTPAPAVKGPSLTGQLVDTQALKGKPYLVNFCATSCVTCVKEQGLSVLAVAMAYDKPEFIQRFAEERELPFVFLHDQDGRWARAFGDVAVTPTTFLVDGQGQMIKRYVGQPDFKQLYGLIQKLL